MLRPAVPRRPRAGEARARAVPRAVLGWPPAYSAEKGHPRLRMRHAPFAIGEPNGTRGWQRCSPRSTTTDAPEAAKAAMREYFEMAATAMINRPARQWRREQAAAEGEDRPAAASPTPARVRRGGGAIRAGRLSPTRTGAGRDPAPAVRARRAGARAGRPARRVRRPHARGRPRRARGAPRGRATRSGRRHHRRARPRSATTRASRTAAIRARCTTRASRSRCARR